jgi:hypothetical protein
MAGGDASSHPQAAAEKALQVNVTAKVVPHLSFLHRHNVQQAQAGRVARKEGTLNAAEGACRLCCRRTPRFSLRQFAK